MPLFSFDYLVFMLPAFILVVLAQWWVNSTMRRWGQVRSTGGVTGTEGAKRRVASGGVGGPAVNIGSRLGWVLILLGLALRTALGTQLAWIGVASFSIGALFSLATLPVELNASSRARALLTQAGLVQSSGEQRGGNQELK